MLLESATIEDALQFVEDNSHPKLWRRLAEDGLKASNFVVADKAFVRCNDYHGFQILKRLQQLDDPRKQEAEVAAYFADFGKCEEIYMAMDRPDLAIEMRMKLGDWFKVERLLEEGGGDDAMLVKAWNNIGEYYGHRQKWGKAVPYYTRAKNSEKLIECFYALEDYAGLQTLLNIIPEGQPILHDLGQRFMSVGLCAAAVKAYMKAGDVKAAINCCIFLHQWDQAIQLAENYQYPQIDVLLVTHFHLDHCGSLAYFTETCGYDGPVYMTHPTRAIVPVMLEDCPKVMARRNREPELWTRESVHRCMRRWSPSA